MGNKSKTHRLKHMTRFAAFALAAAVAASLSGSGSFATGTVDYDSLIADKEAEIKQYQQDNEYRRQQIKDFNGDISENEDIMDAITAQIVGVDAEIRAKGELITIKQDEIAAKAQEIANVEQAISDKETNIGQRKQEIESLEAENKENLKKFAKLCRALYMNDTSDAIPLLSGSDDWYNFFVYSDVIHNVSQQNMEFMTRLLDSIHDQQDKITSLNDEIARLEQDKLSLEGEKQNLEAKMSELEDEKSALEDEKNAQYNELYAVAADNESLKNQVTNLQVKVNATQEMIDQANKEVEEIIRQKQAANSGQTIYSSSGFRWPLSRDFRYITTYFGYDAWRGGNHYGIDVGNAGIGGQPIYAAQSGTVITAYNDGNWHGGYGNYVVIDHGGGMSTLYAHCVSTCVTEGSFVSKGDVIGYVGTTGWSTGNHLHFETRVNGKAVNPFNYEYEYVY